MCKECDQVNGTNFFVTAESEELLNTEWTPDKWDQLEKVEDEVPNTVQQPEEPLS